MTHGLDELEISDLLERTYSSLPSKGVNVTDIPIPSDIVTSFQYNYFTADETTSREQVVKGESVTSFVTVSEDASEEERLSALTQYDLPRFNKISWSSVELESRIFENSSSETDISVSVTDNISLVIYEESLTTYQYTGITFQDQQGLTALEEMAKIAINTSELPFEFTSQATSSPSSDSNLDVINSYLDAVSGDSSIDGTAKEMLRTALSNYQSSGDFGFVTQRDEHLSYLSENLASAANVLDFGMSLSNVMADQCSSTWATDGGGLFFEEIASSRTVFESITSNAVSLNSAGTIVETDYEISGKPVSVKIIDNSILDGTTGDSTIASDYADIVGYIIEKLEVDIDGNISSFSPLTVDGKSITSIIDPNIMYGKGYKYRVRAVSYIEFDAINVYPGNESENTIVRSGFLFASRPSAWSEVSCIETIPPKPPVDIGFIYDGLEGSLNIYWTLPINKQRDIKQINIFKRSSVLDPFGLIKSFYFNDSTTLAATDQIPDPDTLVADSNSKLSGALIQVVDSSPGLFKDYYFSKDSESIYTLTCVDARGLSSNYSSQIGVKYNKFTGKIDVRVVSRSYAPIPYPNYFISEDSFVDTIKVSDFEKMTVYFDPEYITVNQTLYDDDGTASGETDLNLISSHFENPSYKISMINLDNQKSKSVDIYVRDIRDDTSQIDEGEEYTVKTSITSLISDI